MKCTQLTCRSPSSSAVASGSAVAAPSRADCNLLGHSFCRNTTSRLHHIMHCTCWNLFTLVTKSMRCNSFKAAGQVSEELCRPISLPVVSQMRRATLLIRMVAEHPKPGYSSCIAAVSRRIAMSGITVSKSPVLCHRQTATALQPQTVTAAPADICCTCTAAQRAPHVLLAWQPVALQRFHPAC